MFRKCHLVMLLSLVTIFGGCSCNKSDLIDTNNELLKDIETLTTSNNEYKEIDEIFSFYNKITLESVNSFVVVEASKTFGETKYSDGVVVANNGYYYYILTDYNLINPLEGYNDIRYRVMDANASVYEAAVANVYDRESGLLLLRVNVGGKSNVAMKSISLGETSDLVGHISSATQINKIQLLDNIKTNTIDFSGVSYATYSFDNNSISQGALLNINNELCGLYLSNYNSFIDVHLIKYILSTTYSLIL